MVKKILKSIIHVYEEEIPTSLEAFKQWEFTSGPETGEDFNVFARLFRSFVKKNIPADAKATVKVGHYESYGFVELNGKFVFFSISDVRYFKNSWVDDILIRTAKNSSDFTGGSNCSTTLEKFKADVTRLLFSG